MPFKYVVEALESYARETKRRTKMTEEKIIAAFLNGNDEITEDDCDEIDAAKMHEADKIKAAQKRKANIKARKHKKAIPTTTHFHRTKNFKKVSAKKNRRASEMVNSIRGLYHKTY